jgi:sugar/nucleoside kinase (ribokinase family)
MVLNKKGDRYYQKVPKSDRVKKTVGAGDTFTGTLCSMLLRGESFN